MQYEIVKVDNLYIIVVEGRSIMKFRSRRQAAKVLAAAFEPEHSRTEGCETESSTAQSGDTGANDPDDSSPRCADLLRKAQ